MIIVRSPLRISFAGGGTDIRDYYKNDFGAVCSMAINKYVYVTINDLATYFPHRFRIAYSQTELTQDAASIKHPIVREAMSSMKLRGGIDVNVMADIPAGTGMGSSSAFTVSLLHALSAFRNELVSKDELAREASRVEIDVLKEPIGKQDQYAAAFGGINLFRFLKNEQVSVEPLPMSQAARKKLSNNLLMFYLGGNRAASAILKTQTENVETNRAHLDKMRAQALRAAEILAGKHPLDELGALLNEGWELKKNLASGITTSDIDQVISKGLDAGALGGKLLGAGGTGFLLFYCPKDRKPAVRRALENYAEAHFQVDDMGSTLLYYAPNG
ncbi:MAG: GHMP kinase [Deltaproteobacteria bacterium]|nr:GHMP kinase [Deltaproteobacteria bacterium]